MTTNADNSLEQDLLFAIVKEKYGHLLTDEQLDGVRSAIVGQREVFRPNPRLQVDQRRGTFLQFPAFPGGIAWPKALFSDPSGNWPA